MQSGLRQHVHRIVVIRANDVIVLLQPSNTQHLRNANTFSPPAIIYLLLKFVGQQLFPLLLLFLFLPLLFPALPFFPLTTTSPVENTEQNLAILTRKYFSQAFHFTTAAAATATMATTAITATTAKMAKATTKGKKMTELTKAFCNNNKCRRG